MLILLFPIFFSLMTEKLRDFLMTNWSDIRFDILGKVHLLSSRELYSGIIVSLATVANIKFVHFIFVLFRLLENLRVRRAGFAFRQEFDEALQRYINSSNLAFISPSFPFS